MPPDPTATAPGATPTAGRPTFAPPATVAPTPEPADTALPFGFPLDAAQLTDAVSGPPGARAIATGQGPPVAAYSRRDQPSGEAARANASGGNCRVHAEYEGAPAVDWYVPAGTPVHATMDGEAELYVNTLANAFDAYGVSREPYLGDPDRGRAPLQPFPGPGGGMGVYIRVTGAAYRTDYGHLDLARTLAALAPADGLAFVPPYTPAFDYASAFAPLRASGAADQIATFRVRRGDVIGYTGDAGYSEAPHLHYAIARRSDGAKLCPTSEAGFADGGWLER